MLLELSDLLIVPDRSRQTFETIPIHSKFPAINKIHRENQILVSLKLRPRSKLLEQPWKIIVESLALPLSNLFNLSEYCISLLCGCVTVLIIVLHIFQSSGNFFFYAFPSSLNFPIICLPTLSPTNDFTSNIIKKSKCK